MCMHDEARASDESFVKLTVRLPHVPNEEAFMDGAGVRLWMRNCPNCLSTLCREVRQ